MGWEGGKCAHGCEERKHAPCSSLNKMSRSLCSRHLLRQMGHKEAKLMVPFLDVTIHMNSRHTEQWFGQRMQRSVIQPWLRKGFCWERWARLLGTSLHGFHNPFRGSEESLIVSRGWPHSGSEAGRCGSAFCLVSARCRLRPKKAVRRHPRSPHLFIFKQGGRPFLSI